MVVKNIQKGKTTQAEIMEIFGPPDMVTRSGSGEMWGYDKVSREVAEAATGAESPEEAIKLAEKKCQGIWKKWREKRKI